MLSKINAPIALALSALLILVVAGIGWYVLVSPQQSKASDLSTQISAAQAELQADQQLLAAPNKAKTQSDLRAAQRAVPDQVRMSQILRELSALAGQSRTELDTITPGSPVAAAGAEALPISLTFSGKYFALRKLMQLVRKSADVQDDKITGTGRLYSVDNIGFTNGASSAASPAATGLVTATIALNAYVYATPPVAATTTTESTESP
jgi:hypothetical protein